MEILLRYLNPQKQVVRVGLAESWRIGLSVVPAAIATPCFLQAANSAATFCVQSGYNCHASGKVVSRELFGENPPS